MIYSEICPNCGKDVCNGIGGEGMERVNKYLQALPSSHLFYQASVGHDLGYHKIGDGEIGRKFCDERFLVDMLAACGTKPVWQRWFWKIQAYRNYSFVRKFGDNFYSKEGCKWDARKNQKNKC